MHPVQPSSQSTSAYPIFTPVDNSQKTASPVNCKIDTNEDQSSSFGNSCGDCTCGIGTAILGGLCAIQMFAAKSFCCLACAVCVIANGVGCFFRGLYHAVQAIFSKKEENTTQS